MSFREKRLWLFFWIRGSGVCCPRYSHDGNNDKTKKIKMPWRTMNWDCQLRKGYHAIKTTVAAVVFSLPSGLWVTGQTENNGRHCCCYCIISSPELAISVHHSAQHQLWLSSCSFSFAQWLKATEQTKIDSCYRNWCPHTLTLSICEMPYRQSRAYETHQVLIDIPRCILNIHSDFLIFFSFYPSLYLSSPPLTRSLFTLFHTICISLTLLFFKIIITLKRQSVLQHYS